MPRMALCGGFRMGVDSREPNTPPLDTVNVPPVMSSIDSLPSRALAAYPPIALSMSARPRYSVLRTTGTTSPRSLDTATPMSQ